jgi:hypothetical protein
MDSRVASGNARLLDQFESLAAAAGLVFDDALEPGFDLVDCALKSARNCSRNSATRGSGSSINL